MANSVNGDNSAYLRWLEAQRRAEEERRRLEEEHRKAEEEKRAKEAQEAQEAKEAQEAQEAEEAKETEETQKAELKEEIQALSGSIWSDADFSTDMTVEELEQTLTEWEDIEPQRDKALGFLWETGTSSYVTSDGSRIQVSDTEGVVVRQNKVTGEILVMNAKDAKIDGSGNGAKISVLESSLSSLNTGNGDDEIYLVNSQVSGVVNTNKGSDKIVISNSGVKSVNSGRGEDKVEIINGSDVSFVNTESGSDKVIVQNSNVENQISTGDSVDDVIISNSTVFKVDTGNDSDRILINEGSTVNQANAGNGNDVVDVLGSTVQNIDVNWGENTVYASESTIDGVSGGGAENSVINDNSVLGSVNGNKTVVTDDKYEDYIASKPELLDSVSQETAVEITDSITSKIASGELTPEQQTQAVIVNFFAENAASFEAQYAAQEAEDGSISDGYNMIKQFLDLGISKDDIQAAMAEQNRMVSEMTDALNGKSDESFEEVFKRWTGVEYNQEAMTEFVETFQMYQLATTGMNKTQVFQSEVKKASSFEGVFDAYVKYYGSEERAREELNKNFAENAVGNQETGFAAEMYINENNELVRVLPDTYGAFGPTDDTTYTTLVEPMSDITNMFATMPRVFNVDDADEQFAKNFENSMGISIDDLRDQYVTAQLKATGNGSAYQRLIDKYCEEQEGFADKVSSVVTTGGMIMMVGGAVVCIACPPASAAGVALMKAGQATAVTGIFSDEILGAADELTSGNIDWDEMAGYLKEGVTDLALYLSGRGINVVSGAVNAEVLSETGSKLLAKLAEIGVDAPMSLMADYIITGDVSLTGEGISQLMAILTGLAGSRIKDYEAEVKAKQSEGLVDTSKMTREELLAYRQQTNEYNNLTGEDIVRISENAEALNAEYAAHIKEAGQQMEDIFGEDGLVTAREKSEGSVFSKLSSKYGKGKIDSYDLDTSRGAIGDGYGTRLQMKSLSVGEASDIVDGYFKENGIDCDYFTFRKYMDGDISGISASTVDALDSSWTDVVRTLKTARSQPTVDSIVDAISHKQLEITELHNYGTETTSYFTPEQVQQIVDANAAAYGTQLKVTTQLDSSYTGMGKYNIGDDGTQTIETSKAIYTDAGSVKEAGYSSTHLNVTHHFSDGTTGFGEFQIRGTEVNAFADVEHVPYDIMKGKIPANDAKYADIYSTVKNLTDESYSKFMGYSTDYYQYSSLRELGITTTKPTMPKTLKFDGGDFLTRYQRNLLSAEGLIKKYSHK